MDLQATVDVISKFVSSTAILGGALFAIWLYRDAVWNLQLNISCESMDYSHDSRLLLVRVSLKNIGKASVRLKYKKMAKLISALESGSYEGKRYWYWCLYITKLSQSPDLIDLQELEMVDDNFLDDELIDDELIDDELILDELIDDELIDDELIDDELIDDELILDELIDDELIDDELILDMPSVLGKFFGYYLFESGYEYRRFIPIVLPKGDHLLIRSNFSLKGEVLEESCVIPA